MEDEIEKRKNYKVIEAEIIGVSIGTEERIVSLTLYSDKRKTQTNIFLDEEGIRQVANQLNMVVGNVSSHKTEIVPGYQ